MPATLRALLDRPDLHLRLLTDESDAAGPVDRTIDWIHSSDLVDPTPFLASGQALLTTGTQFGTADVDREATDAYVGRLRDRGVVALGFGTEVVRAGTPEALVESCRAFDLPLFEVPYRTSFIAVTQANAESVASEANARNAWALAAQRAISLAAMRPDGLGATLAELSRQLDCWVGLLDGTGRLDRAFPAEAIPDGAVAVLQSEAARLLRGGHRASLPVSIDEQEFTLQTLGIGGHLNGVLAIGAGASGRSGGVLDQAGRGVVNAVIALASLALQQNRELGRARGLLRTGLLTMLTFGESEVVATTSRELWGPLPAEPIRVAAIGLGGQDVDVIVEALELFVQENPGRLFHAIDDTLIICTGAEDGQIVEQIVEQYELHAGISDDAGYRDFGSARAQAALALERSSERSVGVVAFGDLARDGMFAYLAGSGAHEVARALLAPLLTYDDARGGSDITRTVRVWLEHDCEYDRTARALGVHRHTARARIELAGRLLGRDLGIFATRADVWAAFVAGGDGQFSVT
jgi:purine catabolism regulator